MDESLGKSPRIKSVDSILSPIRNLNKNFHDIKTPSDIESPVTNSYDESKYLQLASLIFASKKI